MPYEEYVKWMSFFRRRPVGWREDRRTAMLLKAQGVKASEEEMFPTLRMIKQAEENSQIPDQAVPKGQLLSMMLNAKNKENTKLDSSGRIVKID